MGINFLNKSIYFLIFLVKPILYRDAMQQIRILKQARDVRANGYEWDWETPEMCIGKSGECVSLQEHNTLPWLTKTKPFSFKKRENQKKCL